jgi:hypothetical protein
MLNWKKEVRKNCNKIKWEKKNKSNRSDKKKRLKKRRRFNKKRRNKSFPRYIIRRQGH